MNVMSGKGSRLLAIDALRGLILVLMAIDHVSYFVAELHWSEYWSALPQYTNVLEFLTRFVTHLCAPGFFFLMGASMVLFAESRRQMGWSESRITFHLILRGLLLIGLQLLVEDITWPLGSMWAEPGAFRSGPSAPGGGPATVPYFQVIYFGVLYGLGAAMIVWALLLRRRPLIVLIVSLAAIFVAYVLTPSPSSAGEMYSPLLRLLLIPGRTGNWLVLYPVIPWFGVAGVGVAFGKLLMRDRSQAYRVAWIAGAVFLVLFVALRGLGIGDFHAPAGAGWIAFLNVTKYPPSLVFLLLTLGMDLLLLALFARAGDRLEKWGAPLLTFGQAPLFFYIVHLYLFALVGGLPFHIPVWGIYPVWLVGLLLLYPLCRWYGNFKQRTNPGSVWRFF